MSTSRSKSAKRATKPVETTAVRFSQKEVDLLRACEVGDIDNVYKLLWEGANINCRMPLVGSTPLMVACRQGNHKIASVLIEFGAQTKISDEYAATALHWAANSGKPNLVNMLVSKGRLSTSDMIKKDQFGSTPLHFASVRNLSGSVVALIQAGSDPSITNNDGRKPSELTTDDSIRQYLLDEELRMQRAAASRKKQSEAEAANNDALKAAAKPIKKGKKKGSSRSVLSSTMDMTKETGSIASDKPSRIGSAVRITSVTTSATTSAQKLSKVKSAGSMGRILEDEDHKSPVLGSKNSLVSSNSSFTKRNKTLGTTVISNSRTDSAKGSRGNTLKGFVAGGQTVAI
eukprot:jgi/Hompol1/4514/HPOL_003681-RA